MERTSTSLVSVLAASGDRCCGGKRVREDRETPPLPHSCSDARAQGELPSAAIVLCANSLLPRRRPRFMQGRALSQEPEAGAIEASVINSVGELQQTSSPRGAHSIVPRPLDNTVRACRRVLTPQSRPHGVSLIKGWILRLPGPGRENGLHYTARGMHVRD